MRIFRNLFGPKLNLDKLARAENVADRAQIHLLFHFETPAPLHDERSRRLWERALPRDYMEQIELFRSQGFLTEENNQMRATEAARPALAIYGSRLEEEKERAMIQVRQLLEERDTGEALTVRRRYDASYPLGSAEWTGPDPQMSHSALTRRILFLNHWLVDDLSAEAAQWLKQYAAEQHLWGATWRLDPATIPVEIATELATSEIDSAEVAFWRAQQLALYVENQETWQRCKGGDHVRRIEVGGPDDEFSCEACRNIKGEEFLVDRVPELPHRACSSPRGCRCEYLPVLSTYDELDG